MIVITVPLLYPVLAELRHRSDPVRRHPRHLHRARADLAADRHQPVRHPEHLGRQAVRGGAGHDPVPFDHVRRAGPGDRLPGAVALAAGADVAMTGHGTGENREAAVMRDVAVVGLGQMGRGIARNLDRGGRLAAAWDSSPEAMQRAGLSDAVALAEPGDCRRVEGRAVRGAGLGGNPGRAGWRAAQSAAPGAGADRPHHLASDRDARDRRAGQGDGARVRRWRHDRRRQGRGRWHDHAHGGRQPGGGRGVPPSARADRRQGRSMSARPAPATP